MRRHAPLIAGILILALAAPIAQVRLAAGAALESRSAAGSAPVLARPDDGGTPSEAAALQRLIRSCGTPEPSADELVSVRAAVRSRVERFGLVRLGATIPIAFHVIVSSGVGDVTDRQIDDQIRVMNQAYSGSGYRFVLASVDRTENKTWFTMAPGTGSEKQAKRALAIDPAHNLNVYTCAPGKNLLGWAYFPFSAPEDNVIHGVVIHYGSLPGGYLAPYDLGGTLIHESGHYLGLFHTFEGGCVAPGDEVDDTPFEASPAFGCPIGRNTCPQPGDDPIHDYMDYTDDACYSEFTSGQVSRINAILPVYRPSLFRGASLAASSTEMSPPSEAASPLSRGGIELRNATPNPFENMTTLRFALAASAHVSLSVYSLAGQRVRTLIDAALPPGDHTALLDARGLAPGTYFAALRVGEVLLSRSMVHVR